TGRRRGHGRSLSFGPEPVNQRGEPSSMRMPAAGGVAPLDAYALEALARVQVHAEGRAGSGVVVDLASAAHDAPLHGVAVIVVAVREGHRAAARSGRPVDGLTLAIDALAIDRLAVRVGRRPAAARARAAPGS